MQNYKSCICIRNHFFKYRYSRGYIFQMTTPATRRLLKDWKKINQENPEGYIASPVQDNLLLWLVYIEGAENTIWQGGLFALKLEFTEEYPQKAPNARFMSKMFHPNIYPDGRICIDMLQKQWSSVYDIFAIITVIQTLLGDPNTLSPTNI